MCLIGIYNRINGIMPDNNSLSDNKKDYIMIYDVRRAYNNPLALSYHCDESRHICKDCYTEAHNAQDADMLGQTMEILRYDRDDILAKLQRRFYEVKNDNGMYYITNIETKNHTLTYNQTSKVAILALQFARKPYAKSLRELETLSSLLLSGEVIEFTETTNTENITAAIRGTQNNGLDRQHAQILVNDSNISDEELLAKINSTYVNVVHDCKHLCVQSTLSVSDSFVSTQELKRYGLLCVNKLTEMARTQRISHTPQASQNAYIAAGSVMLLLLVPCALFCIFIARSSSTFAHNIRVRFSEAMSSLYNAHKTEKDNYSNELQELSARSDAIAEDAVSML